VEFEVDVVFEVSLVDVAVDVDVAFALVSDEFDVCEAVLDEFDADELAFESGLAVEDELGVEFAFALLLASGDAVAVEGVLESAFVLLFGVELFTSEDAVDVEEFELEF